MEFSIWLFECMKHRKTKSFKPYGIRVVATELLIVQNLSKWKSTYRNVYLQSQYTFCTFDQHFMKIDLASIITPPKMNLEMWVWMYCNHVHGYLWISCTSHTNIHTFFIFNNDNKARRQWPLLGVRFPSHTMMTLSNWNIFRVTGPLCSVFTGRRWIPRTKASDTEL